MTLERRTPLRRETPLVRRTRIRVRSKKRAADAQERRDFVAYVLDRRPLCEFYATHPGALLWTYDRGAPAVWIETRWTFGPRCTGRAVDVHETWSSGRGGPRVPSAGLTAAGVAALCRTCHDWIHNVQPEAAEVLGFLHHSWEMTPHADRPRH